MNCDLDLCLFFSREGSAGLVPARPAQPVEPTPSPQRAISGAGDPRCASEQPYRRFAESSPLPSRLASHAGRAGAESRIAWPGARGGEQQAIREPNSVPSLSEPAPVVKSPQPFRGTAAERFGVRGGEIGVAPSDGLVPSDRAPGRTLGWNGTLERPQADPDDVAKLRRRPRPYRHPTPTGERRSAMLPHEAKPVAEPPFEGGPDRGAAPDLDAASSRLRNQVLSGDRDAVNEAVRAMYPGLLRSAQAKVARSGLRSREPETIVDSVLMRGLNPAAAVCPTDADMERYLYRVLENVIRDAGRKRHPVQFPADADSGFGPCERAPAPDDGLIEREANRLDDAALGSFMRAIDSATLTSRERQLVDLFVVRGLAWEHVAATLGLTSGAARTAMSRLRSDLLPQLLSPLRPRLKEADWRILEETVINRRHPEQIAEELGIEQDEIMDRFMFAVMPAINRAFGRQGMAMLRRLMHKPASRGEAGGSRSKKE